MAAWGWLQKQVNHYKYIPGEWVLQLQAVFRGRAHHNLVQTYILVQTLQINRLKKTALTVTALA